MVQVETLGAESVLTRIRPLLLAEPLGDGLPDLSVIVVAA